MSKFFVGQRVRVIKADRALECVGREARVVGDLRLASDRELGVWEGFPTEVDGIGHIGPRGRKYVFPPEFLEPILPEGSAPSEFTFQQLMDNLQEVMA